MTLGTPQVRVGILPVLVLSAAAYGNAKAGPDARITGIRELRAGKSERIVIQLDRNVEIRQACLSKPKRLYFDFHHTQLAPGVPIKSRPAKLRTIRRIRLGHPLPQTVRAVLEVRGVGQYIAYRMRTPAQLVIELMPGRDHASPCREGALERPVKLSDAPVIVIDPGHGGRDQGERGRGGSSEAQVALAVGKRLAVLLRDRGEAEAVLTRQGDRFLSLPERTAIAKGAKADAFVSLHAEAGPRAVECGPRTYYLALTTSQSVLQLASRENAVNNHTVYELPVLISAIMRDQHAGASRDLARSITGALSPQGSTHRQQRSETAAPLAVLMGVDSPGVVVSLGCLKSPAEAKRLRSKIYQGKLAQALYAGISDYLGEKRQEEMARVARQAN